MRFYSARTGGILAFVLLCLLQPFDSISAQSEHDTLTFDTERPLAETFTLYSEDPAIPRMRGNRYANGGAVIFHEGQYHLFSNVFNNWPGATQTFYYTSPDGITWTRAQEEPLFTIDDVPLAGTGALVLSGFVEDDGTWVLYYHTFTSNSVSGVIGRITADAPAGDWVFDETPVLSPGSEGEWDDGQVMRVNVIPTEDGYVMYYAGVGEDGSRIGMARSDDGITWEKHDDPTTTDAPYAESDPIMLPTEDWEQGTLGRPEVVRTDDGWVMLYEGGTRGSRTGMAISEDGITFYRYAQNPIFTTDNMVNRSLFFQGAFYHQDDQYYYLIEAGGGSGTDIFLFTIEGAIAPIFETSGTNEDASTGITIADRNNIGNGADLWVQFTTDAIDQEVRLFVIKAGQDFTLASAMDNPNYMNIVPSSASVATMLSAEVLDSDGDAIQEGIAYALVVLDVEAENLSEPSNTVTLQNEGVVYTVVTGLPAATGGLDIDADGNLYFADFGEQNVTIGNTVYRITPQGDYEVFFESDDLASGTGNTFDADGNFYQSGYGSGTVLRVSPEGVVDVITEDLSGPVGVVINDEGILYVNTCNDSSIARITPDGEVTLFARSRFLSCPNGLTQDENGNLYVANFRGSSIAQVTPDGEVSRIAQLPGSNGSHALYHNGILYAVSRGTHQVFTVTLDGEVELLAGTGERGNQDGALLEATFTLPNALAISPDGRVIYINEVVAETDGTNYPSVVRAIVLPRSE